MFYSLFGFILSRQTWQKLFLPLSLFIFFLPFEGYLDVYAGFPLRLLCADWANEILTAFGINAMSSESLILIENRAANVDVGCSGIKGLWAGGLFYLSMSIMESYRISLGWILIGLGFMGTLIVMNVIRIVLLVLLYLVLDLPFLAGMVHKTVGLSSFGLSLMVAWFALRAYRGNNAIPERETGESKSQSILFQGTMSGLFILGLLLALLMDSPRSLNFPLPTSFKLPPSLQTSTIPLSSLEQKFFSNNRISAEKRSFQFEDLSGSLLIVNSMN